jgi:hypothetical protein
MVDNRAKYIYVVRMDVEKDVEEKFNNWYNNEHIPALLKVPGVLSGRRYVSLEGEPKYTAVYEFDRRDIRQSVEWKKAVEMTPRPADVQTKNVKRELHQLIYPEK